jgi:hypothetical protein
MHRVPSIPKQVMRVIEEARSPRGFPAITTFAPGVDKAPMPTSKTMSIPDASSIRNSRCSAWKPCRASGLSFDAVRLTAKPLRVLHNYDTQACTSIMALSASGSCRCHYAALQLT